MKSKIFALVFIIIGFVSSLSAQNEDVIPYFTASEHNGKVLLTFAITQGNTCNGVNILRSIDSVNFTIIGSINGVCGRAQEELPYEFTDLHPIKNERNYYRLSLGGIGFSWIVSAEVIDVGSNNYMLRPNPISDSSELHFNNDGSNTIEMIVYDQMGTKIKSLTTNEELIILQKSDYKSGTYFFVLINAVHNSKVSGRFVVP